MIRYALLCREDHAFEAWFPDSDAFEAQSAGGQVACPACGTIEVRKALMAPAVKRPGEKRRPRPAPAQPVTTPAIDAAGPAAPIVDEPFMRMRAALRDLHAKLKREATDVGSAFPEQARAIHGGEAPARMIYGTATDAEVKSLVEDGVGIMPIPALPDDRN